MDRKHWRWQLRQKLLEMPLFQAPEVHHIYALQRQGKQKSYRCQNFSRLVNTLVVDIDNSLLEVLSAAEVHIGVDPFTIHEQGIEQAVETLEVSSLVLTWRLLFGLVGVQHLSSAIDKTRMELKAALHKTIASIKAVVISDLIHRMYCRFTRYGPATGYSDRAIARAIAAILLQCNILTLEHGDDLFTVADRLRKHMRQQGRIKRLLTPRRGEKTYLPPDIDIHMYEKFR